MSKPDRRGKAQDKKPGGIKLQKVGGIKKPRGRRGGRPKKEGGAAPPRWEEAAADELLAELLRKAGADDKLSRLQYALGYNFRDPRLLEQALTHSSASSVAHNGRLAWLGDSVMQLVITEMLYGAKPEATAGELTQARRLLETRRMCATLAGRLGIGELMMLRASGSSGRFNMEAECIEALLGAIYIDSGLEMAPVKRVYAAIGQMQKKEAAAPQGGPLSPKAEQEGPQQQQQQPQRQQLLGERGAAAGPAGPPGAGGRTPEWQGRREEAPAPTVMGSSGGPSTRSRRRTPAEQAQQTQQGQQAQQDGEVEGKGEHFPRGRNPKQPKGRERGGPAGAARAGNTPAPAPAASQRQRRSSQKQGGIADEEEQQQQQQQQTGKRRTSSRQQSLPPPPGLTPPPGFTPQGNAAEKNRPRRGKPPPQVLGKRARTATASPGEKAQQQQQQQQNAQRPEEEGPAQPQAKRQKGGKQQGRAGAAEAAEHAAAQQAPQAQWPAQHGQATAPDVLPLGRGPEGGEAGRPGKKKRKAPWWVRNKKGGKAATQKGGR